MSEHDFEPIRGLPQAPPPGEDILWQGSPDAWRLSCQAFHIRAVAAYFAAMLVWRVSEALAAGAGAGSALLGAILVAPIPIAALATLGFFGWLNSRTTVYTITNKRVVLRFGAALTKAINIPFTVIEGAALKRLSDGSGDLALTLKAPNKIAFLQLWPHVRPWKLAAPQPTLRALADSQAVADLLATAMRSQVSINLTPADVPVRAAPGALRPPHAQAA